jgi:DNA-binding MarR family transcriptional regulator
VSDPHPTSGLEDVVHQRARLGILAVLVEAGSADFAGLKQLLALTDGNLSRHLTVLEEAGYVRVDKVFEGKRPRTTVRLTGDGKTAFEAEIAALEALLQSVRRA